MYGDLEVVPGEVEDYLVELAAVSVVVGVLLRVGRRLLIDDNLARVVFVDIEAVRLQVDGQGAELLGDLAVLPTVEDAAGVGPKGDDVAQDLELGELLVDLDIVPLEVALDCCRKTSEPWRFMSVCAADIRM